MKRVERGVSTGSISSVLDLQKLPMSRDDSEDQEFSFPIEKAHKIRTLLSASSSVVERVVLLESLSDDFKGPLTPRRSMDEDAADVEKELVEVAPIPTIGQRTPGSSQDRRPCDPVARFLLSKS